MKTILRFYLDALGMKCDHVIYKLQTNLVYSVSMKVLVGMTKNYSLKKRPPQFHDSYTKVLIFFKQTSS